MNPGIIPIPKSRDSTKFSNPEIPGLRLRDPGIMKIEYFARIVRIYVDNKMFFLVIFIDFFRA